MDRVSQVQRSKVMSSIKAKSKLEDRVAHELFKRGLRYRRNNRNLVGVPDISIQKYKIVIFIDSCFWHGCPIHCRRPKSNKHYWNKKLDRNMERDKEVTAYYRANGWNILRIWEHELKEDYEGIVKAIEEFVKSAMSK